MSTKEKRNRKQIRKMMASLNGSKSGLLREAYKACKGRLNWRA